MDCERVQDLLSEHLEGTLPGVEQADVASHLQECLPCRVAKEGLEETLLLLRDLPPRHAPPDLLEGIRSRIAREEASARPLWKKLFLPAYVKIPLEAAAAVVLFLLVYGAQKEDLSTLFSPRPAARTDAAPAADDGKTTPGRGAEKATESTGAGRQAKVRKPAETSPAEAASESVSARAVAKREDVAPGRTAPGKREAGTTARRAPPELRARSSFTPVPAQRISTAGERIGPGTTPGEEAWEGALARNFPAPPPMLLHPVPLRREVTIEVTAENRPGLEDRIALAAARFGGSAQGHLATPGSSPEGGDTVRCRVPAGAAKSFLDELSRLGTLPQEGPRGVADFRSGRSPDVVAYTVRIRLR